MIITVIIIVKVIIYIKQQVVIYIKLYTKHLACSACPRRARQPAAKRALSPPADETPHKKVSGTSKISTSMVKRTTYK